MANLFEWMPISTGIPFDTAVEVKDDNGNQCEAFNQCYPPFLALCKIPEYKELDFVPTFWREKMTFNEMIDSGLTANGVSYDS